MPLDTTQILGAAAAAGANDYFTRIADMVNLYNGLPAGATGPRIEALDTVMMISGDFLTSERPTAHVQSTARWTALADLANQCYAEIQTLGAKMVSGPADFKTIGNTKRSYWLERLDPHHRPGFVLSPRYADWLAGGVGDFWTYMGNSGINQVGQFDPHMPTSTKAALVKLFTEDQKGRRVKYRAVVNGTGSVRDMWDQPKTTWDMHSAFGGQHWGIFVLSPGGELYVNSHKVGRFHHSTFLGGAPAAAAGELVVDFAGHIVVITNKTGHYLAGVEEMTRLVTMLPIPDETLILPNLMAAISGPVAGRVARFYRVGDFRARGEAATPLSKFTVKLRIPTWARDGHEMQRIVNLVP